MAIFNLFKSLGEGFSYDFMRLALVVGLSLALCAALIGVPLVLKRSSMIGDGLSHVAFGAFAIAFSLSLTPLYFAIPVVLLAAFLVVRLNQRSELKSDAIIAVMSAAALAIGSFAITVTGANVDINSYLFGSILSLSQADLILSLAVTMFCLVIFTVFYHKIFAISFDEDFARSIGVKTQVYSVVFAIMCALVIVLGMRMMGALLISSLMIFPVLTAQQFAKSFRAVVLSAGGFAVLAFLIGLAASYLWGTPSGSTIVLVNLGILIVAVLTRKIRYLA